ncbi:hypothetical protein C8J55DRAFT_523637 [Lentinula edodes]|uniref:Uncharacterized protein n=1 Tax=Lentinula lateritia TaxID=40482 RepID=A0A9W8ZYT4_9AGAR|nr:hypothetical protein C8J55DRAFT_523637 [Lentinula edodes]
MCSGTAFACANGETGLACFVSGRYYSTFLIYRNEPGSSFDRRIAFRDRALRISDRSYGFVHPDNDDQFRLPGPATSKSSC